MSNNLIYYSQVPLFTASDEFQEKVPGIKNFLTLAKFLMPNVGVTDLSGTFTIPFRYTYTCLMPVYDPTFNYSYREVAQQRMVELEQLHNSTGKNFRLFYSGGVDSTTMFAAFVEYFGVEKTSKILEISCSKESIDENPWLWDRYIRRNNFKLVSSHEHANSWDAPVISLMGEGNDQLFGGMGTGRWNHYALREGLDLYSKINETLFADYLQYYKNSDRASAEYAANKLLSLVDKAPMPIENMYMLVWWYTFCTCWDGISKRILSQSRTPLSPDILSNSFLQFFNTPGFQQWSLRYHADNPESYGSSLEYKMECKKMSLDILDIPEYATKSKWISWPRVHSLRIAGHLIDDDYKIYYNLDDFLNFIEPNNSFIE